MRLRICLAQFLQVEETEKKGLRFVSGQEKFYIPVNSISEYSKEQNQEVALK